MVQNFTNFYKVEFPNKGDAGPVIFIFLVKLESVIRITEERQQCNEI